MRPGNVVEHLICIAGKNNLERADLEPAALKALKYRLMTKNVVSVPDAGENATTSEVRTDGKLRRGEREKARAQRLELLCPWFMYLVRQSCSLAAGYTDLKKLNDKSIVKTLLKIKNREHSYSDSNIIKLLLAIMNISLNTDMS
ncbi:hypothetical protein QQ045_028654 [Rhodiola kirilowii]